jgi:hypothetical protein
MEHSGQKLSCTISISQEEGSLCITKFEIPDKEEAFVHNNFNFSGKDWKWGDQDGGSGSKGYVYDVSELTGVCKVWSK